MVWHLFDTQITQKLATCNVAPRALFCQESVSRHLIYPEFKKLRTPTPVTAEFSLQVFHVRTTGHIFWLLKTVLSQPLRQENPTPASLCMRGSLRISTTEAPVRQGSSRSLNQGS